MKKAIYPRLAVDSIRKNRRLYLPYLLTCIGMVMMLYILFFLTQSETVRSLRGHSVLTPILGLGCGVIAVFACIFLFYTNSFLIRRREKEFGLYNILGMGKKNIARVLFWESLTVAALSIVGGLGLGILFSKLAELLLIKILGGQAAFRFTVSFPAVGYTAVIFLGIFLLLLLNSIRRVCVSSAANLLKSENAGEKPPKTNWLMGVGGFLLLGGAYYLAVSVEDAVDALVLFFVAVIMVILATYLLMISGSVLLCRILQKSKKYYYNKKHFVSVSSMAYRMKRSGASLASICIIATMVLVTVSSTSCLNFGKEDAIRRLYPSQYSLKVYVDSPDELEEENLDKFRTCLRRAADDLGSELSVNSDVRFANFAGALMEDTVITEVFRTASYSTVRDMYFFSQEDFNAAAGTDIRLKSGECAVYCEAPYAQDVLKLDDRLEYRVVQFSENVEEVGAAVTGGIISDSVTEMLVVVKDASEVAQAYESVENDYGRVCNLTWYYAVDTAPDTDGQIAFSTAAGAALSELDGADQPIYNWFMTDCRAEAETDFYTSYGGLFFIGILLSAVFICAAVLIIYYKQISEGYEDQARFEIMQKVGMTKKEIRRSINSQLLTVFFLPLLLAGLHLCFAFPMVRKLLLLFSLDNVGLFALTNGISFAVFALLYAAVYKLTSNAYYNIVSGAKN